MGYLRTKRSWRSQRLCLNRKRYRQMAESGLQRKTPHSLQTRWKFFSLKLLKFIFDYTLPSCFLMYAIHISSVVFETKEQVSSNQARNWEGPLTGVKLKSCPTKPKFALVGFIYFLLWLQMTLVYFKIAMSFLKKKLLIRIYLPWFSG